MKLYVKSQRAFILDPKHIIAGGEVDDNGVLTGRIMNDQTVELVDAIGEKLSKGYPKEFVVLDTPKKKAEEPKVEAPKEEKKPDTKKLDTKKPAVKEAKKDENGF